MKKTKNKVNTHIKNQLKRFIIREIILTVDTLEDYITEVDSALSIERLEFLIKQLEVNHKLPSKEFYMKKVKTPRKRRTKIESKD